ncbi:hypothetical protein BT93_D0338 [Corymbia citriodora subsp. variegata]|nr:hypothetical protein BT93_D0338 [Corymbia citriodora subsp. variegata]
MTTELKAHANSSQPEEGRLQDPRHNLPRDGEHLAPPSLASPSCLLT